MITVNEPGVTSTTSMPTKNVEYQKTVVDKPNNGFSFVDTESLTNQNTGTSIKNRKATEFGKDVESSVFSFQTPNGSHYQARAEDGKTNFYKFSGDQYQASSYRNDKTFQKVSGKDFNTAREEAGMDAIKRLGRNEVCTFRIDQKNANILDEQNVKDKKKP